MKMQMNKQQSGFTLIELVMVIVVLGILAATALPKFVNLGADARAASMKAVEGSMRSANAIIYAKAAMAAPPQSGRNGSVSVEGTPITTRYGYASTVLELAKAMDLSADYTPAAATIVHAGAAIPATCRVTYTAAKYIAGTPGATPPVPASVTAPTYALLTDGC